MIELKGKTESGPKISHEPFSVSTFTINLRSETNRVNAGVSHKVKFAMLIFFKSRKRRKTQPIADYFL
jgi:hypothetical protein